MTATGDRGVAGAVLAGGASRRMGADKATLEVDGRPMVMAALEALHGAGVSPVCLVGGDPATFPGTGHGFIPDRWPGEGPLGGILTALSALDEDGQRPVIILACDLPDASAATIGEILDHTNSVPDAVVLPMLDGVPQWLHALWPPGARATLAEAFEAGERAPWRAGRMLPVVELLIVDEGHLRDVDTPDDLRDRGLSGRGPTGSHD